MATIKMKNDIYITSNCTIANGVIQKDGHRLFNGNDCSVNDFLLSAYQHFQFNYPKFYKMDNLSKLGWLGAEVLLSDISLLGYKSEDVAVLLTNANSSLDDDLKYLETVSDIASPSLFVYTLSNIVMGEISIRHKLKGEQAFFVRERFDAEFVRLQVSYLLNNDKAQACICGWVDVLGEEYKAALFFVEKQKKANAVLFSALHMEDIFNRKNSQ